jgi:drug/metabolite transporter (DMT)-like permease
VAFASWSIAGKWALRELSAFGLATIRISLAAAILIAIAAGRRRWRVPWRDVPALAALAALGIAANQLLFVAGLARTTATMAVILGASIPVFTVVIAAALGREAPTRARLGGVAVGLAGAIVTVVGGELGGRGDLVGNLLIVANSLAYASYLVLGRAVLLRHDPWTVITWVVGLGAIMVVPFGARDAAAAIPVLSGDTWAAIAWIVVVATVGTYGVNAWALARAPATLVATYVYVQPVVGAALAAVVLGERPGWTTVTGGALIAAGVWMVARARR